MRSYGRLSRYAVLIFSFAFPGPSAFGMPEQSSQQINFLWKSHEDSVLSSEKEFLVRNGATIDKFGTDGPSAGIGPAGAAVLILAGSAAACVLAQSIIRAIQASKGGLELDIQKKKIAITPRRDMTNTHVYIRKPDGTEINYEVKAEAEHDLCKLLTSVLRPQS